MESKYPIVAYNPGVNGNKTINNCFVLFIVFVFNPLIGIVLSSLYAIKTNNSSFVGLLIIFLSLYLSAINSTKTPESDMKGYLDMFLRVPANGFWKTLCFLSATGSPKDIVYSSSVFFFYYLLFGNQHLFIFFTSLLIFNFSFRSIFKFSRQYGLPIYLTVVQILTLGFFSQYFNLSAHLIRQQLAVAIFFYALTFRHCSLRKYLLWSGISVLTHSSLIIIAMIGLIPFMNKRLNKKELLIVMAFGLSFVMVFSALGNFLLSRIALSGESLTNIGRMANMEGATDGAEGGGQIMNTFSALLASIALYDTLRKRQMVYPIIVNLCLLWSILVLCLSKVPILQYRFFFIEYNFLPFIIFLPFRSSKSLLKLESIAVVVLLMFLFYSKLNSVFNYIPVGHVLMLPFPFLIHF